MSAWLTALVEGEKNVRKPNELRVAETIRAYARPDEHFGPLSDAQVLAIASGIGEPVAAQVLQESGGLVRLASGDPSWLKTLGLTAGVARKIRAALELGERICARRSADRPRVGCGRDVAAYMGPKIGHLEHEEFWALAIDGNNGMRSARRVARGGLHGCAISARDILRPMISDAASGMILVHNHPSGDPTPSSEDIAMTKVVFQAADVVGIPVVDHVIVTSTARYASFADLGLL